MSDDSMGFVIGWDIDCETAAAFLVCKCDRYGWRCALEVGDEGGTCEGAKGEDAFEFHFGVFE